MDLSTLLEFVKIAKEEKPGLWANIRAKRKRGEPAAKPGDKDYPDKEQWNKLTEESKDAFVNNTLALLGIEKLAVFNFSKPKNKHEVPKGGNLRVSMIYPNEGFTPESYALTVDSQTILNPDTVIIPTEDYQDFSDDPEYMTKLLSIPGVYEAIEKRQNQTKNASSPAWQRSEGKNREGGLNAKGRASYNRATGGHLKAPVTESNPKGKRAKRRKSFCSRMCGMKRVNTGAKAKRDPDSRINKSLRKWNCKCGSGDFDLFGLAELIKEAKAMKNKKRCWDGYKPVKGKKPYSEDSCEKA
jgi:hypothetical protein